MANLKPDLERVRYWQGQRLSAADLREQIATDLELRRLHDAGAHGAAGVAVGLSVSLLEVNEVPTEVLVRRGLAYDCLGRLLVLTSDRRLQLPPAADTLYTLVIFSDSSAATGVSLYWRPRRDAGARQGVALAVLLPSQAAPHANPPALDASFRPVVARPLARPYSVQGRTIPGQTIWQPWVLGPDEIGVQVRVDTSLAGFTSVPHYFAAAVPGRVDASVEAAWFASIADPTESGFTLRLMLRGLTAQSFAMVDPLPQVLERGSLGEIAVDADHALAVEDEVVRLAPIVEIASVVRELTGRVATLAADVPSFPEKYPDGARLGVCVMPRIENVISTSDVIVHLAADAEARKLTTGSVVATGEKEVHWADVNLVVNPRVVELSDRIADAEDILIVVDDRSLVTNDPLVEEGEERRQKFAVDDVGRFRVNDTVVRLAAREGSTRARVVESKDGVLTVTPPFNDLKKSDLIGKLSDKTFTVATQPSPGWQRVRLGETQRFSVGDLVTRWQAPVEQLPPRIEFIHDTEPEIVLNGTVEKLSKDQRLAAATITTRVTVRAIADTGVATLVYVDRPERFPVGSLVASTDGRGVAGKTLRVDDIIDGALSLSPRSTGLSPGQVIGLYEFPRFVEVNDVLGERTLRLESSRGLSSRDVLVPADRDNVIRARPELITLVESVESNDVRVTQLSDVRPRDRLFVVSMGSVVTVEDEPQPDQVRLDDAFQLRRGDALGLIVGWREADLGGHPVRVTDIDVPAAGSTSALIELGDWPDGLVSGDVIGFQSLTFPSLTLRLEEVPALEANLDSVSLEADDALLHRTVRAQGRVTDVQGQRITIHAPGTLGQGEREYRPRGIDASASFLRGPVLRLIRNQDLFVSWLACADPLPMPREWPSDEEANVLPDCPCASAKES
jgi:hypothetical protein